MKHKFRLTLQLLDPKDIFSSIKRPIETIEADSILQLVLQFTMLVTKLERQIHEEELNRIKSERIDDDIPF